MIVNIRGTGGSGKSTVVRRIMTLYDTKTPVKIDGRKQPLYYTLTAEGHRPLAVIGHYETACGGGDTITSPAAVFDLVRQQAEAGHDVIFEGIISQDDVTRTSELRRDHPLTVLVLTTSMEDCLKGIQQRRDARGDVRPLSEKNTRSRADRLRKSIVPRLKDNGVHIVHVTREDSFAEACKALGW